jgi:hypothetical protein
MERNPLDHLAASSHERIIGHTGRCRRSVKEEIVCTRNCAASEPQTTEIMKLTSLTVREGK